MTSQFQAGLRHSRHYAEILLQADRLYEMGGRDVENGLQLFDLNWHNIEMGQEWAMQRSDQSHDAATLVSEYPERGAHCLYLRQKPAQRLLWLESALRIAKIRGMELVEGTLHGKIGLALSEMGEHQKAMEHYLSRIKLAKKLGDNEGLGEGLCNLGILYDSLNMLEQARTCYESAIGLAENVSNQKILEVTIGNLGLLYLKEGEFYKAKLCFDRHLELARSAHDLWSLSNALSNSGIADYKLQNFDSALEALRESIRINHTLGDLVGEAKNLSYIGAVYLAENHLEKAAEAYEQRIVIARKLYDEYGEAIGSWNLGEVLIKQKKYKPGLALMEQYLQYGKRVDAPGLQQDLEVFHAIQQQYDVEAKS